MQTTDLEALIEIRDELIKVHRILNGCSESLCEMLPTRPNEVALDASVESATTNAGMAKYTIDAVIKHLTELSEEERSGV